MSNTVPSPPIERRATPPLVEDLCLELRYVAVRDHALPDAPDVIAHIQAVQRIYAELHKRQVDVHERIAQLSTETKWQMHDLLRDCLAFPKVTPYVKESDGIRRALRCCRCQQREMPDRKGIWLCDACLAGALHSVESRTPEDGFVLFRTYNQSKRCEHADADTVLLSLDEDDWVDGAYCQKCLSQEQQRRTQSDTGASVAVGETWDLHQSIGETVKGDEYGN